MSREVSGNIQYIKDYLLPLKQFSQNIYEDVVKIYYFTLLHFSIVRLDASISNRMSGVNLYIDNGNSLENIPINKSFILSLLRKYVTPEIYRIISDFSYFSNNEISFGFNLQGKNDINFNLGFVSLPIKSEEVEKFLSNIPGTHSLAIGDNEVLFGINFSSDSILSYKVYYQNIYPQEIDMIDAMDSFSLFRETITPLGAFDDIMLLVRYDPEGKKSQKLYYNYYKDRKFYLNDGLLRYFQESNLDYHRLEMFMGKRIVSIASNGGDNIELYFDLVRHQKRNH